MEEIHELQYADDTAFVSSSPDGLQRTINAVAEAYSRSSLAINIGKTEVLNMCQPPIPTLLINQQPLKIVEEFTYLGSVLITQMILQVKCNDVLVWLQHLLVGYLTEFS